jgi:hypothetical protein
MLTKTFLADLAERATAQYLESFLGFLLMAETLDVSVIGAAALGAIPAVLSLVKNLLLELSGTGTRAPNVYVDVLERAGVAYVVSLIGLLLAAPVLSVSALSAAAVAAVPAGLAVLKGFVAGFVGRRGSAAALPAHLDPAA